MLPFIKPQSVPLVGLDISSSAVKLIELKRERDAFEVIAYAVTPLPPEAVVEKDIKDVEAVTEQIRKTVKKSGTKAKQCAMAVPGAAAITKVIQMPADLGEDEREAQVQADAGEHIPYKIEEVNLDFTVLGPSRAAADSVDVLIAASRSENVETRVAAAEAAGLTAKVMDIEAYAIEHVFPLLATGLPETTAEGTVAVFDVGATMTALHVIHNREIVYTREQPFGGQQLTEEIMRRYGLNYDEAARSKRSGGLPESYTSEVLEPFKDATAQQINRLLQIFYSSSRFDQVDQVLLGGGCAAVPGIEDTVGDLVSVPVALANPFANLALDEKKLDVKGLTDDAPSLLIACGLATRRYD